MAAEDWELPVSEERDALMAALRRLVSLSGAEPLLTAPVLLPEPTFFPEPLKARGAGVALLLRRLLHYAGLPPMHVQVEIDAGLAGWVNAEGQEQAMGHAAAWFLGIEDGVCCFGVDDRELDDPLGLVGTLAHEVAHAYREHYRLVARDAGVEEKLTDVTSVYLGFGVLLLESSYRFRTGHYDRSGQQLLYERQERGYLAPGQKSAESRGSRGRHRRAHRPSCADPARRPYPVPERRVIELSCRSSDRPRVALRGMHEGRYA